MSELYHPRAVSDLGNRDIGTLQFKVYSIIAEGQELTKTVVIDARAFAHSDVLTLVKAEGEDNGLGFVIIHSGDLGVSVLVHWWIQGSVLCQHIKRTIWGMDAPMNTAARPVIACVWELGIINAEQNAWRETMMIAVPNAAAYLNARTGLNEV